MKSQSASLLLLVLCVASAQADIVTVTCFPPTTREEGELLPSDQILGYDFRINQGESVRTQECRWVSPELPAGNYLFEIRTVDTQTPAKFSTWVASQITIESSDPKPPSGLTLFSSKVVTGEIQ